jgi:hypothetical protein
MNKRSEILRQAENLVNGDRNRQYGDPKSDFQRTAMLWERYLNGAHERHVEAGMPEGYILIEPHDVAVLMMLLKVSRLAWSPEKEDSWADLAGYAACGWDCASEVEDEEDEVDQDDIAVDLDALTPDQWDLLQDLFYSRPPTATPGFGGFLTGTLFGKDPKG